MKAFSRYIFPTLIIALCATCVGLKISSKKTSKTMAYYMLLSETKDDIMVDMIKERTHPVYMYNSHPLSHTDSVYSFEKQKRMPLENLVQNGPVLALRILETDCEPCIDTTLSILASESNKLEKSQMVIITDKAIPREIIVFARIHKLSCSIVHVGKGGLNVPIEDFTPYFFTLNKNNIMYDLFLVDKRYPELTKSYLKLITRKILETS